MSTATQRIAIITDTTCDLPQEFIQQYQLHMVPQYVIWGTEEYDDLHTLDRPTFYKWLPQKAEHPHTAAPSIGDYLKCVEAARQAGAEEIIAILVSQKLSGSVNAARQAEDQIDMPFHIFDTHSVSMGLGWQVLAACRAREAGADVAGILAAADAVRRKMSVLFTVDTLEYLHKGGRIGGAAKWFGTALQLKPSLYVDRETGQVEGGERIRTRRKALDRITQAFLETVDVTQPIRLAVVHAAAEADADYVLTALKAEIEPVEVVTSYLSPAIGVHGGPGALAAIGYSED